MTKIKKRLSMDDLRECRRCFLVGTDRQLPGTDRQMPRTGAADPHHPQEFSPPPSARSLCDQERVRVFLVYF